MKNKFVLGTANFGKKYGLSNHNFSKKNIENLLNYLIDNNIHYLDTAQLYGDSEKIIGDFDSNSIFKLITKFKLHKGGNSFEVISNSFVKLKKNKIYALMYHDFEDYLNFPNSLNILKNLKKSSKIKKIGFSLYFPSQLDFLLKNNIDFDLIQIPYNLFDQRFEKYFKYLNERKIEIHVRSIFLQGLFFKTEKNIPTNLKALASNIKKLHQVSYDNKLTILESAIYFVFNNKFIDKVVVGVDSLDNLKEIFKILNSKIDINTKQVFKDFEINDENLILPINW